MNAQQTLVAIDEIRVRLSYQDSENRVLVSIVRDLWDGPYDQFTLDAIRRDAELLRLADASAESKIKKLVADMEVTEEDQQDLERRHG